MEKMTLYTDDVKMYHHIYTYRDIICHDIYTVYTYLYRDVMMFYDIILCYVYVIWRSCHKSHNNMQVSLH